MPERSYLNQIGGLLLPLVISIFGGLVRAVRTKCTLKQACVSMLVAAFTGVIVSLFLQDVAFLTSGQKAAITGIASYSGGTLLDVLSGRVCQLAEKVDLKGK